MWRTEKHVTLLDLTTSYVSNRLAVFARWFNSHYLNLNCRFLSPGSSTRIPRQHDDILCPHYNTPEPYFEKLAEISETSYKPVKLVLLNEIILTHSLGNLFHFTCADAHLLILCSLEGETENHSNVYPLTSHYAAVCTCLWFHPHQNYQQWRSLLAPKQREVLTCELISDLLTIIQTSVELPGEKACALVGEYRWLSGVITSLQAAEAQENVFLPVQTKC